MIDFNESYIFHINGFEEYLRCSIKWSKSIKTYIYIIILFHELSKIIIRK